MRIITVAAIALALAASLPAQVSSLPLPVPPPGGTTSKAYAELQTYLNLTEAQLTALENIQQQQQQAVNQIYTQLSQKSLALSVLLQDANPNALAIGQTMIDIQNLQKQLYQNTPQPYHDQALAVLNPSQVAKLGALSSALQLQNKAYQAVNLYLISGPPQPILAATSTPGIGMPVPPAAPPIP